jgi:probable DNA repair protein
MLFDSGKQRVDVADLRYLANQVKAGEQQGLQLGKCLQQVAAMRDLRDSKLPSRWLVPLCDVLDSWGWPGRGPLDSLEHQQVQQWYGVLEELASYDDVCGPVSLEGALGLLQTILGRQISQPQTADTAIQVLGSLEAAGLVFDYLWLSGMQASRWPAAARPNPFIPLALQRDLQMPHATAEREWAFAQGLMQQYQRSAGALYASYARQADSVAELPSALLKDFALEQCGDADQVHPRWTNAWRNRALEVVEYSPAPALAGAERAGIGGGSALLEDQSQCPFRAFARRRLLAEPLGEPVTGVSAAQRGSLLHQALHCLFDLVPDSDFLQQLSGEAETDLVTTAVQVALDELPRSGLQATAASWRELEGARLHDLLRQWLDVERQRSAFIVASKEEDFTLELETLELRLRVDRIDHLPDGSAVIIDYKSGRCSLQDWLGERPARPQLLLYGIAAQEVPAALSFAQLRPDECTFVGAGQADIAPGIKSDMAKLVRGGWDIDSWEALNARWRGQLQALATEFVNGDARVEPQANACTWCGLQGLCRVGMEQVVMP